MEFDSLVQQALAGLDTTHPVKPEPISDTDASSKSLDEILNVISGGGNKGAPTQPEKPSPHESVLDKLIAELKSGTEEVLKAAAQPTGQNPPVPQNPFGPEEDWGEERY